MTIQYVLGFAFTDGGSVALIQKSHPEWQAGRWNGLGGKVYPGEAPNHAMAREFEEEAGVRIAPGDWREVGLMTGEGWHCFVYTARVKRVFNVRTMEKERVMLWSPTDLRWQRNQLIENVPMLIELCKLPIAAPSYRHPTVLIQY